MTNTLTVVKPAPETSVKKKHQEARLKVLLSTSTELNWGVGKVIIKGFKDAGINVAESTVDRIMDTLTDKLLKGELEYDTGRINCSLFIRPTKEEIEAIAEMILLEWKPLVNRPVRRSSSLNS